MLQAYRKNCRNAVEILINKKNFVLFQCSFYEHCAKPETPIIPCEKQWLGRGPMQDVTTQKHDFTWKLIKPVAPHKLKDNIYTFPNRLAGKDVQTTTYFYVP